jgi:hypothetical protein
MIVAVMSVSLITTDYLNSKFPRPLPFVTLTLHSYDYNFNQILPTSVSA